MRGLDALAAACAPQKSETGNAGAPIAALSEEQCKQIATMVIEQLQGGQQQKTEPETPEDPDDGDEKGENENAESES